MSKMLSFCNNIAITIKYIPVYLIAQSSNINQICYRIRYNHLFEF